MSLTNSEFSSALNIVFKLIMLFNFATFLYFGFDMKKRPDWKAMAATPLTALMKIFSLALAASLISTIILAKQILWSDWFSFFFLLFGALIVRSAKKELLAHNAFTWTGYVLPKPKLVTSGIYSYVRHPLYTGVFLTVLSGLIFFLPRISIWFPNQVALICSASVLAAAYTVIFNIKLAERESNYLRSIFGSEYEEYARRVNSFVPNFKN